jgi:hypothetical protein
MSSVMDLHPFFVEAAADRLAITLTSAWGAEAKRYRVTLGHLLDRLAALEASLTVARLDSAPSRRLSAARRTLELGRTWPIAIAAEPDLDRLRKDIGHGLAAIKLRPRKKGGNSTRRLRLEVTVPGAMSAADLHAVLVDGNLFAERPRRSSKRRSALRLAETVDYRSDGWVEPREHERRSFADNPDLRGRGARAHTQTQDAFASALRRCGLRPKSASRDGRATFDIAWSWAQTVHVGEVKSLAGDNEERQLRLGLGQVLRYRDLADASGVPSRAWLIVEREPADPSWHRLCGQLGVTLCWPAVFDETIGQLLRKTDRGTETKRPTRARRRSGS